MPFYYDMGIGQIYALPHMKLINTTRGQTEANLGGASYTSPIYSGKNGCRITPPSAVLCMVVRALKTSREVLSLVAVSLAMVIAVAADQVKSPDGKVTIDFLLQTGGTPAYKIGYSDKPIVLESRLGFEPGFTNGFQVVKIASTRHEEWWTNAFGERRMFKHRQRRVCALH